MDQPAQSLAPLFLAHGAPTLALDETPAHKFLQKLGDGYQGLKGVVILSPHWETDTLHMSAPGRLKTIHDFRGFSEELHAIDYPAYASDELVGTVKGLLVAAGHKVRPDPDWGLDHGAWVPLSLAFPEPEFPIVALSLPHHSTPESVHGLGRALAPLADEGILLIGSGSTTHNLGKVSPQGSKTPAWAGEFDAWLDKGLQDGAIGYFSDLNTAPHFRLAHPTEEHLLPLFFALGAAGSEAKPDLLHRSYEYGTLSMSYYRFAA